MNQSAVKFIRWVPALGWMVLIFSMSHQPGGESGAFSKLVLEFLASWGLDLRVWFGDNAFWVIRKMAHFTEYFILFNLIALGLGRTVAWPRMGFIALGITTLYAATDEFHQLFIPKRVGDLLDVGVDSLGAATGLFLHFLFRLAFRRSNQPPVS